MTVREMLAFEAGCEDYCEREVEVEWQGGRAAGCTCTLAPAAMTCGATDRLTAIRQPELVG
jgi:hypothetical protein